MDSSTPESIAQLRAENQRLRAQLAAFEDHGAANPPSSTTGPPLWFDSVSDAIFVADATWTIQHWNQAAAQLYGWAPDAAVGRPIRDLIAVACYLDGDSDAMATQALRTAGSWRGTMIQHTRDGREVVVEGATRALTDAQGQITGYIGINRDVTARVQAKQTLQGTLGRLQILAAASHAFAAAGPDEAALLDEIARLTAAPLVAACTIWRASADAQSLYVGTVFDPDPAVQAIIRAGFPDTLPAAASHPAAMVARSGQALLIPVIDPEAMRAALTPELWSTFERVCPHSSIVVPLRAHETTLGCLVFTRHDLQQPAFSADDLTLAQDLADRAALALANTQLYQQAQAAQQAAAEALARLDALITSTPTGIGYLDCELRYQLVNPALAAINHRTPEEHLGHTLQDLLPSLAPRLEPIMRQVLETGEAVRDLELHGQLYAAIQGPHDWLISYFPIYGPANTVTGVGVTVTDVTVSTRTAAALRDSELRFRMLFETMAQGVVYHDTDGQISTANLAAEQILGLTLDELQGRTSLDPRWRAIHEDGTPFPGAEHPTTVALRTGQEVREVVMGVYHPGEDAYRWISIQAVPTFRPGEMTSTEVAAIFTDITAQRAAHHVLAAERQQLATILDTMHEGLIAARPDGTLALINPAALRLGDLDPGTPPARVADLIPTPRLFLDADGQPVAPDDLPLQRVLRGERMVGLEQCQRSIRDGTEHWHLINGTPAYDAAGQLQIGVITFKDITDRKRAEAQLRQHEAELAAAYAQAEQHAAQLSSLIAHAPIGIALLDQELRFQHVNVSLAAMNGLPPEAHLGRRLREVLPALATALEPIYHQVLATGAPLLDQEIRGESPAMPGELRAWRASYFPVRGTSAAILGVGVVVIDVTTQQQAEQALAAHADTLRRTNAELAHTLQLKDEFLAMISHELRTPLNVILGYSESLAEEIYGPLVERQRNALAQVTASGQHLLGILTDILDLTALEGGRAALDPAHVTIDDLCRAATQLVAAKAQRKRIQLSRTVAVGVEALRADERRLTQILVNLLDNAIKFTPAGGQVGLEVTADATQEQIAFTVWDSGIGIAEADYPRLFQPFTQIDARLARDYEGIGLGLSLVRRLVELHGGSIQLASQPGLGSRFTVSLPWAANDNVASPPLPSPAAPPPQRWATPPLLVIADDHEETLVFYRERLTQAGCTLAIARTGAEALAQLRATRPDVAILDIQMPELDGLTAIRQIRADPELGATPIVALTALAMPGDRECCLEAGANVYLAKPVSIHTLLAAIAAVLPAADALPPEGAGEGAP